MHVKKHRSAPRATKEDQTKEERAGLEQTLQNKFMRLKEEQKPRAATGSGEK